MLPTAFENIADEMKTQYKAFLESDQEREQVPELLSAEEQIKRFLDRVGLDLLEVFVDVRVEQAKAGRKPCGCGQIPSVHKSTTWTRETVFGPLTVHDPYVYCRTCHDSERPLHALLGTDRETWSLLVQEHAVDLATDESCGKAVAKLGRLLPGVEMERTCVLRMIHHHGQEARKFINEKLAKAQRVVERSSGEDVTEPVELEVQFDAGMIPVATLEPIAVPEGEQPELTPVRGLPKRKKNCRWEEAKVGLVQSLFEGEVAERLYSLQPTGGLEKSFEDLWSLSCILGWTELAEVRGIADGARYIRSRLEDTFDVGNFRFILDRPHCKQHLSSAGAALETITGVPAQEWASAALETLEQGHCTKVVAELEQVWLASGPDEKSRNDTLRLEGTYFKHNQDAVAYAEYRDQNWSTASSEVESSHQHTVQCRLKIPGAWWHPEGVDDILALRMLKANNWWDEYWQTQRANWRERAATFA